jgi:hypothetical protein
MDKTNDAYTTVEEISIYKLLMGLWIVSIHWHPNIKVMAFNLVLAICNTESHYLVPTGLITSHSSKVLLGGLREIVGFSKFCIS